MPVPKLLLRESAPRSERQVVALSAVDGVHRLDEMGPHNREIPLAALGKSRGRSKAGKPGTRALRQKSHKPR